MNPSAAMGEGAERFVRQTSEKGSGPRSFDSAESWSRGGLPEKLVVESRPLLRGARRVPWGFANIQGEFTVFTQYGEKCGFSGICKRQNCLVRYNRWMIRSWVYDCKFLCQSGDYLILEGLTDDVSSRISDDSSNF